MLIANHWNKANKANLKPDVIAKMSSFEHKGQEEQFILGTSVNLEQLFVQSQGLWYILNKELD